MKTDPIRQVAFGDDENGMWLYRRFLRELEQRIPEASSHIIGASEKGEPIYGFDLGSGPVTVSLVAGAHADEPVGPNTLYRLILEIYQNPERFKAIFSRFRFLVIPHVNPDGDAANASWITRWPDPVPFFSGMKRELPGRDIEFGYPEMRPENRAATGFWEREGPADLHFSLHGMQFSEGYLLLINDEWEKRTRTWRKQFDKAMRAEGLAPHDHDRGGDKGFNYMGPGFTSTPKGKTMRDFFLSRNDAGTAAKFHMSSMEYHIGQNPETVCMVTEFPLYVIRTSPQTGTPENYLALKQDLANMSVRADKSTKDQDINRFVLQYDMHPLPLGKAMRLQRHTIRSAMELAKRCVEKSQEK